MFTESMFSTPRAEAQQPDEEDGLSAWPPVAAASFAWVISLVRLLMGQARQESLHLDLALSAVASLLIPAIVLLFWLSGLRRRSQPRARVPAPTWRAHPAHVRPESRSALLVETSTHAGNGARPFGSV